MLLSRPSIPFPCSRHQTIRLAQHSLVMSSVIYLIVHSLLLRPSPLLAAIQEQPQHKSPNLVILSTSMMPTNDSDHSPREKLLVAVGDERNLSTILDRCAPTAQVRLAISASMLASPSPLSWKLLTFSLGGEEKRMGGDEFYVVYVGPNDHKKRSPKNATSSPTAVARVTDREDGTYDLQFVAAPSLGIPTDPTMLRGVLTGAARSSSSSAEAGKLYIILQYTCDMGSLPQPEKESWSGCGALNRVYQIDLPDPPPIIPLEAPAILSFSEGYNTSASQGCATLRGYDRVFGFGDSLIRQFFQKKSRTGYEPTMQLLKNIGAPLDSTTLERHFLGKLRPHLLAQEAGMKKNSTDALVLGSGVWDVMAQKLLQGYNFEDHLRAVTLYIQAIKTEFPGLQLYWKSMTALHVHELLNVQDGMQIERVLYLSESRSKKLYELQVELMKKLEVSVLNVYPLSYLSADMLYPGDGRHYGEAFNEACVKAFYTRQ